MMYLYLYLSSYTFLSRTGTCVYNCDLSIPRIVRLTYLSPDPFAGARPREEVLKAKEAAATAASSLSASPPRESKGEPAAEAEKRPETRREERTEAQYRDEERRGDDRRPPARRDRNAGAWSVYSLVPVPVHLSLHLSLATALIRAPADERGPREERPISAADQEENWRRPELRTQPKPGPLFRPSLLTSSLHNTFPRLCFLSLYRKCIRTLSYLCVGPSEAFARYGRHDDRDRRYGGDRYLVQLRASYTRTRTPSLHRRTPLQVRRWRQVRRRSLRRRRPLRRRSLW
jgi:hypothetical protein